VNFETQIAITSKGPVGARLDSFIASQLTELSRTRIQRAIEDGDLLVNNRVVKPSYRLREGDQIELDLSEPPPLDLLLERLPLDIVYEDSELIVVNKSAGMVVHPGAGIESGTLANALAYHFANLSGIGGAIRPGIVHRLDKDTSGLLVVAKNDFAHENLSDQFRNREVFKQYQALVYGNVAKDRIEIQARIGRSKHHRTRMAVVKGDAGRSAHTIVEVRKRLRYFSLVDVEIKTGRTHQIRVHLAYIGHPVVGDETYGSGRENTIRDSAMRASIHSLGRQFLHSAALSFNHPRSGERMTFGSPLPDDLKTLLSRIE